MHFYYEPYEDGVRITGCSKYTEHMCVPAQLNGLPVRAIAHRAFFASSMKELILPDCLRSIADTALLDCTALERIHFGAAFQDYCPPMLRSCPLKEITVSEDNRIYSAVNGVLYHTHDRILLRYPCAKEDLFFQVPDGIESVAPLAFSGSRHLNDICLNQIQSIGIGAFQNCTGLAAVHIPDSVYSLPAFLFYGCAGLEWVELPADLCHIESTAFEGCDRLKNKPVM